MKKALITGANGFVGSHLVKTLLANDFQVFAGVRKGSDVSAISELPCEIRLFDYSDIEQLSQEIRSILPDILIHCAGVTVSGRLSDFENGNVIPTQHLLKALANHPLQRFIFISSLAARGPGESSVDNPVSAYGRSKLKAEKLVRDSGLPWNIVRPTAIYGEGDKGFLPLFQWAKRGVFPQLGSAHRRLTFVLVDDLCRLVLKSVDDQKNELIYGWDGKVYEQHEVTAAFRKAAGKTGMALPIPSFLFGGITGMLDVVIRRFLKFPWAYPPEKMKELLAEDWGISANEMPEMEMTDLTQGFQKTFKNYFPD